jgi:hypothetical protein
MINGGLGVLFPEGHGIFYLLLSVQTASGSTQSLSIGFRGVVSRGKRSLPLKSFKQRCGVFLKLYRHPHTPSWRVLHEHKDNCTLYHYVLVFYLTNDN